MPEYLWATRSAGHEPGCSHGTRVTSAQQLEVLMDQVVAEARPVWLELAGPSETCAPFSAAVLHIALGAAYSSAVFCQPGGTGHRYDSVGTVPNAETASLDDLDEVVSAIPGTAIDVEVARRAAIEFLGTGERSKRIEWTRFNAPTWGWMER